MKKDKKQLIANYLKDEEAVFTTALHETAHFITFVYYSAKRREFPEINFITIVTNEHSLGFFQSSRSFVNLYIQHINSDLRGLREVTQNRISDDLKVSLAGYAIEFIEQRHEDLQYYELDDFFDDYISFLEMFDESSDAARCFDILEKINDKHPENTLLELFRKVTNDCKALQKDISEVAKILFKKKTIKGKAIEKLSEYYFYKYLSIENP